MKKGYIIAGAVCLLAAAACLIFGLWPKTYTDPLQSMASPAPAPTAEPEKVYVSPIDFEKLQAENPDIYAWIQIEDTNVSFPVLQREGDDAFYLNHNSAEEWTVAGAIYTEETYNTKTFEDPATLVYGHRMRSGDMFGNLQKIFSDKEGFESHKEIIIYLPDRELHYQIFGAFAFNNLHLLANYDFESDAGYQEFLDDISAVDGNFREEIEVTPQDKMLILCTCLRENRSNRYLVAAKLMESDN